VIGRLKQLLPRFLGYLNLIMVAVVAIVTLVIIQVWGSATLIILGQPITLSRPSDTQPSPGSAVATVTPTATGESLRVFPYKEDGEVFRPKAAGQYQVTITGGAYSFLPSEGFEGPGVKSWRSRLFAYRNGPVIWATRSGSGPVGPVGFDFAIGNGDLKATRGEAEKLAKGMAFIIPFSLKEGDFLTFVAIDEKGKYDKPGINMGEVDLSFTLIKPE
jgi:hypothetical protein